MGWAAAAYLAAACLVWNLGTANGNAPKWAMIHLAAVAVLVAVAFRGFKPRPFDILWLLFASYAGASLLWSPDPGQGAIQWVNLTALGIICSYIARQPWREPLSYGIAFAAVGAVLSYHQWPFFWGGYGNENFIAEFLLLCIPFCMGRRWPALLFIGWFYLDGNRSQNWIAVGGMFAFAGWLYLFKVRAYWLATVIALGVLIAVLTAARNPDLLQSAVARAELWINAGGLWLENPIMGYGFGSFNFEYPRAQEFHHHLFPWLGTQFHTPFFYAGAAHNEPLQVLVELGLIGLGLCVPLAVVGFSGAGKWVLTVAAGLACIGFPFQNPATALLCVVALSFSASSWQGSFFGKAKDATGPKSISPMPRSIRWPIPLGRFKPI